MSRYALTSYKGTAHKKALAFGTALLLGACSPLSPPPESPPKPGSPEELLSAEGDWKLVEEKQEPNPQQQHLKTRKQVSPTQLGKSATYTEDAKAEEAHVDEDVHFRVLKLERQMKTLQGDFDTLLPPLAKMAKNDPELQTTIRHIQSRPMDEVEMPAEPLAHAPAPPLVIEPEARTKTPHKEKIEKVAPPGEKHVAKPDVSSGTGPTVTALRTGDHPGKTRLVLDLTQATHFSADLDPAENLLVIEMPEITWAAAPEKSFGAHPLLKSYTAEATKTGTRLVIELKGPAKLAMKSAFKPSEGHGHRIVLDIASQ